MTEPQFREKFIAYVDILGFKAKVKSAEHGEGLSLSQLLDSLSALENRKHSETIHDYGPRICPKSLYVQPDLDYRVTQLSDCAVVSAEKSPAGSINLIAHADGAALKLLTQGMMVRGYITRGKIFHEGNKFIGTGYQTAVNREKEVAAFKKLIDDGGTPFIEIDPAVVQYINECGDPYVQEKFTCMTKSEGDVTVIFPYQRLSGLTVATDEFEKIKQNLETIRLATKSAKSKVESFAPSSDPDAARKAKYYFEFLNAALQECDRIEQELDAIQEPYPSGTFNPEEFPSLFRNK